MDKTNKGKLFFNLGDGWNKAQIKKALEEVLAKGSGPDGFTVETDIPGLGRQKMQLKAWKLDENRETAGILLMIEDVTDCESDAPNEKAKKVNLN